MPRLALLLHDAAWRPLWRRVLWLLAAVAAVAALVPTEAAPSLGLDDKIDHLLAFASLGLAALLAQPAGRRAALAAGAGLQMYGALIEVAQTLVPGRDASWADLGADALGIGVGLLVAVGLRQLWPAPRP